MRKAASASCAILILGACLAWSIPAAAQTVPDFSGVWGAGGFEAPATGRGGVRMHPDYQERGTRADDNSRQTPVPHIADLTDPLLQPWARTQLEGIVERLIGGEIIPDARSLCTPMGTPMLLIEGGPRLILQTLDQVTMVYEELPEVRHIHLNAGFPDPLTPSWYGEAIGHYEGDTLVVTTAGISNKTWVDDFLTPHTEAMRVTERYRLMPDGNMIEVSFTVEDPETFNEPWGGIAMWEREPPGTDIQEIRCSEYNYDVFTGATLPMPIATKLDF